jgi:hypothetical protein
MTVLRISPGDLLFLSTIEPKEYTVSRVGHRQLGNNPADVILAKQGFGNYDFELDENVTQYKKAPPWTRL